MFFCSNEEPGTYPLDNGLYTTDLLLSQSITGLLGLPENNKATDSIPFPAVQIASSLQDYFRNLSQQTWRPRFREPFQLQLYCLR